MLYQVKVEELSYRIVEVEAKSKAEAIAKVEDMYNKEEIVLDYSDFEYVDIKLYEE